MVPRSGAGGTQSNGGSENRVALSMLAPLCTTAKLKIIRRLARIALAATLTLAVPRGARAQSLSALSGRVMRDSTEIPVLGAEVIVQGVRTTALTDSLGHFLIRSIPPGKAIVSVKRLGFAPMRAVLTFAGGDTVEADFLLSPTVGRLKGVEIRARARTPARLVGFEDRRRSGFGQFIGPEELANMQSRRTDDVLRTIPGPSIVRSNVSGAAWIAAGRGAFSSGLYRVERTDINRGADAEKCYATVYVDGVPVFSALPGELLFDINSVPPNVIHGMEYYGGAGTIPPEFPEKRGTCGVLVIWTKS